MGREVAETDGGAEVRQVRDGHQSDSWGLYYATGDRSQADLGDSRGEKWAPGAVSCCAGVALSFGEGRQLSLFAQEARQSRLLGNLDKATCSEAS